MRRAGRTGWVLIAVFATTANTFAQPAPDPEPEPGRLPQSLQVHGFISQGAFISTANDYIGVSSRGSLEFFEAGLNVSLDVADNLRAGIQFFARDVGQFRDIPPRLDWAYLDYHWKDWLGLRGGIIKMPFGLHNEYADIDSARLPILLPQSVYPLRDRSALLSHTGFSLYGTKTLGDAGDIEYQAWLGTLDIPSNSLEITNAKLDEVDTKYVTGAQLFWRPFEGLRVGGSYLRASIDFKLTLDASVVSLLVMGGLVPPDFNGKLDISQRPTSLWVGSAEYEHGDWQFAAEYARSFKRQRTTLPDLLPTFEEKTERFYGSLAYRICARYEVGAYYSVLHADVGDRRGRNEMKFPERFFAWQRDAAATVRLDVNDHWTWKLEAHFIDGVADLFLSQNPDPERYWGLFLLKTTVTF